MILRKNGCYRDPVTTAEGETLDFFCPGMTQNGLQLSEKASEKGLTLIGYGYSLLIRNHAGLLELQVTRNAERQATRANDHQLVRSKCGGCCFFL